MPGKPIRRQILEPLFPMPSREWARSGRRPASSARGPKPEGSWGLALARARESWDGLIRAGYSETAAAAILDAALGLWADTAASLGPEDRPGVD